MTACFFKPVSILCSRISQKCQLQELIAVFTALPLLIPSSAEALSLPGVPVLANTGLMCSCGCVEALSDVLRLLHLFFSLSKCHAVGSCLIPTGAPEQKCVQPITSPVDLLVSMVSEFTEFFTSRLLMIYLISVSV